MTGRPPRPRIADLVDYPGKKPTPPPPPLPEPVRVPRTPRTPPAPRGWPAAVAGTCSHGGHGWDGETCSDIEEATLPGMPATALVPGDAMARAEQIAPKMTADPEATPRGDDPWTPGDVIGIALARGLEQLEELYGVTP